MRSAVALAVALALTAPTVQAEPGKPAITAADPSPGGRRPTEYLALKGGGGLGAAWLGAGGELTLATLRWDSFFWSLIRAGGYAASAGEITIAQVHAGTLLGFSVFRSENEEARFGFGLNFSYGQGKHYDGILGPGLMVDLTQVWHLDDRWSAQLSISLLGTIVASTSGEQSFSMPLMPSLLVQFGFGLES